MRPVARPRTTPAGRFSGLPARQPAGHRGTSARAAEGRPYDVPVANALGPRALYLASGPGRKRRALDAHPRVCLTVCDVRGPADWRSVVVEGTLARVLDDEERTTAIRLLLERRAPADGAASARPDDPSPDVAVDARQLRAATLYRLPLDEASGRARGAPRDGGRWATPAR